MGNHTYRVLLGEMTWAEALRSCRVQGMDLASVADSFQQASLSVTVNKANTSMWIGLVSKDVGTSRGHHPQQVKLSTEVLSIWSTAVCGKGVALVSVPPPPLTIHVQIYAINAKNSEKNHDSFLPRIVWTSSSFNLLLHTY